MSTQFSAIMIELDSLFDTRLATIFSFGVETTTTAFDEQYYNRQMDKFDGIDREVFQTRYRERTKAVLKDPLPTPMLQFVRQFVLETNASIYSTPHHMAAKVIINTYPYQLNESEELTILRTLTALLKGQADVEIVHMSFEELTPKYVKQNLSVLVLYEYHRWIEIHAVSNAFKHVTCPEVTLIGPMIIHGDLPTAENIKECKELNITPYQAVELVASPLIGLKLLPIEHFSMAARVKKRQSTTTT